MSKISGYVRVSTIEQRDKGISLAAQENKVRAYCTVKDWTLHEIIKDGGGRHNLYGR